jgi:CheY-like chemotaxis protein/two-component sensor histidine kinase
MEKALMQSEKLKSIGTITAGISHEFNNILAIISGNVQLLEETYEDQGELTDMLRTIGKAVDDGAEISRNMLKFTMTKKGTEKFVSSHIRDLIRQSVEFTMPRWKNMSQTKGINYQIAKEGMKSVSPVMCNPTEIKEVFINIINNALDAMPEGGSISFSTWDRDETVLVSITDTGEGMSEEVKKNIFDPFFSTKTPKGTGLGMSIAYGIVTRHGGKIEIESEVGEGSTFTLEFPSAKTFVSPKAIPKPEQKSKGKNLSILVVDDEEDICDTLDQFLSKRGNKVKAIDNGAGAIKLINSEYFDLVLCDLAMPNGSGFDVIKAINRLGKIPKIGIITGWGEKIKPIEEEGTKVDFVLKKPFKYSALSKCIDDAFSADSR